MGKTGHDGGVRWDNGGFRERDKTARGVGQDVAIILAITYLSFVRRGMIQFGTTNKACRSLSIC